MGLLESLEKDSIPVHRSAEGLFPPVSEHSHSHTSASAIHNV
jgi:hypothetical protein